MNQPSPGYTTHRKPVLPQYVSDRAPTVGSLLIVHMPGDVKFLKEGDNRRTAIPGSGVETVL